MLPEVHVRATDAGRADVYETAIGIGFRMARVYQMEGMLRVLVYGQIARLAFDDATETESGFADRSPS